MSDPVCFTPGMKRTNTSAKRAGAVKQTAQQVNPPTFEQFADVATAQVEHRTIFDFLRLIPHPWHADEMARFGDKVKRMADSIPLAFVPLVHPQLGVVRAYPVPFMQWIYGIMAKQFGWPLTAIALEDGASAQRDELRRHEGAKKHLESAAQHTTDPEILAAMAKVTEHLEREAQRLRGETEPPSSPTPPPLRVV